MDYSFQCDSVDNFTASVMEYSSDSEGDIMTADDDVQSDQSASESDSGKIKNALIL